MCDEDLKKRIEELENKPGDIDPREIKEYCFSISDKSLARGGSVLEAVLRYLNSKPNNETLISY